MIPAFRRRLGAGAGSCIRADRRSSTWSIDARASGPVAMAMPAYVGTVLSARSIGSTMTGASTTSHALLEKNERQGGAGAVGEEAMNADQLKKNVGQDLRLRPHPMIVQWTPDALLTGPGPAPEQHGVPTDYRWRLVSVNGGVTLHCHATSHEVTLGPDSVREFRA